MCSTYMMHKYNRRHLVGDSRDVGWWSRLSISVVVV